MERFYCEKGVDIVSSKKINLKHKFQDIMKSSMNLHAKYVKTLEYRL